MIQLSVVHHVTYLIKLEKKKFKFLANEITITR